MGVGPRRAGGVGGDRKGKRHAAQVEDSRRTGREGKADTDQGRARSRWGGGSPALIVSGRGPYRVSGSSEGRNEMAWRQDCSVCDSASHCSPARARPAAGGKPARAGALSLRARSARLPVRPERGRRAKPRMQEEL